MGDSIIAALIGIGTLVLINIAIVAYGYGKLSQKLEDACRRLVRLEGLHNNIRRE